MPPAWNNFRPLLRDPRIMRFSSTNSPDRFVAAPEAVLRSLPADNGLYMPETIPTLPQEFWGNLRDMSFADIGYELAAPFFGADIPEATLREIIGETLSFDAPVVPLGERDHILELFHGPTLAFKDFGARFMARVMAYFTRDDSQPLTVLVATSGDTGGAVADAFHKVEGTRVIILYPSGKVSGLQEKQLTTLGDNISACEIDGTFDDCQRLVKSAFLDAELSKALNLTSANSINIARLVPQSFYYAHAARQLPAGVKPTFVVPSGNFGNLTAGLLAHRMGLPVDHFVAATNVNDVVPEYLKTGIYTPRPSSATISNAMDVGAPSNFIRMVTLFGNDWPEVAKSITGYRYDDVTTRSAIRDLYQSADYAICPHGAVGWLAARDYRATHPDATTVVLGTAHPAKFIDTMDEELGHGTTPIPERLACLGDRKKVATPLPADESTFHKHLESL